MSDQKDESFKEKIRSIGFVNKQGTSRKRDVINDDTGKTVGHQVDHWDGRVDAVAHAPQGIYQKIQKGTVHE